MRAKKRRLRVRKRATDAEALDAMASFCYRGTQVDYSYYQVLVMGILMREGEVYIA